MAVVYRNITGDIRDPQGNPANGWVVAKLLRPLIDSTTFISPEEIRVDLVDGDFTLVLAAPAIYDFQIKDTDNETWWNFQAPLDNDDASDISLAELYVLTGYIEQTFELPVVYLADLLDVTTVGVADHEQLTWDAAEGYWRNHLPELGELYEDNDAGSSIMMTTAGVYYGWVTATEGTLEGVIADTTNVVADTLAPVETGRYEVRATVSFSGEANSVITACVHVNNTPQANIKFDRKLGTTGDVGSAMCSGILDLTAGDLVDLRFSCDVSSKTIQITRCNMLMHRV